MAKKPKQKKSTSGHRKMTPTKKSRGKREQSTIYSSASSWLGNFCSLARIISCLESISNWMNENSPF